MTRRLYPDLIEAFVHASADSQIPESFRRWAALSAVAGALGRRCWYDAGEFQIHPNLYIVLVAGPGVGKSAAMILPMTKVFSKLCEPIGATNAQRDEAKLWWERYLGEGTAPLRLIQDRITAEKLSFEMGRMGHLILDLPGSKYESAVTVCTDEFGTFMASDAKFLQAFLTKAWDAPDEIQNLTKNAGTDIIKGPCLNWLAGATPEQFVTHLPANAQEQGLLSRIIPVWADSGRPVFKTRVSGYNEDIIDQLRLDLGAVARISGEYVWGRGVEEQAQAWLDGGLEPRPALGMAEYENRRFSQLVKMAIAIAAARRNERVILAEDWATAQAMLFAAERDMPKVYVRFGMSEVGKFAYDLLDFVRANGGKANATYIKRHGLRIVRSGVDISRLLTDLVEAGDLIQDGDLYTLGRHHKE